AEDSDALVRQSELLLKLRAQSQDCGADSPSQLSDRRCGDALRRRARQDRDALTDSLMLPRPRPDDSSRVAAREYRRRLRRWRAWDANLANRSSASQNVKLLHR